MFKFDLPSKVIQDKPQIKASKNFKAQYAFVKGSDDGTIEFGKKQMLSAHFSL